MSTGQRYSVTRELPTTRGERHWTARMKDRLRAARGEDHYGARLDRAKVRFMPIRLTHRTTTGSGGGCKSRTADWMAARWTLERQSEYFNASCQTSTGARL